MTENPAKEDIVAVSLFRDAGSAAVIGGCSTFDGSSGEKPCYELVTGASRIVDGTGHLVDYFETNSGAIRLLLDKDLPEYIGKSEPDFVAKLLQKGRKALYDNADTAASALSDDTSGSSPSLPAMDNLKDVDILCHTGGPKVLREVAKSLHVTDDNLHSSWEVMRNNGNLSGASNLAVLNHHNELANGNILGGPGKAASEWSICLSMGPGVCLEGVLLRDVRCKFRSYSPIYKPVQKDTSAADVSHQRNVERKGTFLRQLRLWGSAAVLK